MSEGSSIPARIVFQELAHLQVINFHITDTHTHTHTPFLVLMGFCFTLAIDKQGEGLMGVSAPQFNT